jgi:hypothetical protein
VVSHQKWTVTVEREIDGLRIVKRVARITAGEALAMKYEEESLPGRVVCFDRREYQHGDTSHSVMFQPSPC